MEIDSAMLALGADGAESKLLHIFSGGFDKLIVSALPGQLAPFYLVLRVGEKGVLEEESHEFSLTGLNPDGDERVLVPPGKMSFQIAKSTYSDSYSYASIMVQISFIAKSEGRYQFLIMVDGKERKRLDLTIALSPGDGSK